MRSVIVAFVVACALASSTAQAQLIYDNFGTPVDTPYLECGGFDFQGCAEDMIVASGGQLTSFRYKFFNHGSAFFGGSETQSWDIYLLLDDGDNLPEIAGPTPDTLLFTNSYVGQSILFDTTHEQSENLFASNIVVSPGSRIWGVVTGLGFNMGVLLNDAPPPVGTTDSNIYRFGELNDVIDVSENAQSGWQTRLNAIVPEPATLSLLGISMVALLRRRR